MNSFGTRLVYWESFILYLSLRSMFSSFVFHSSIHHCCCWEHEEKSGLLKIHFVLNFLLNIKLFPTDFIVIQIKFLSGDCRLSMHFLTWNNFLVVGTINWINVEHPLRFQTICWKFQINDYLEKSILVENNQASGYLTKGNFETPALWYPSSPLSIFRKC